jgi:serine-type D-Ala-D-Ala carboxypeptidase (penicillin-binding protein 5/6)
VAIAQTRRLRAAGLALLTLLALLGTSLLTAAPVLAAKPTLPTITVTAPSDSGEPQPPGLTCKAALVMDADTGQVLFSKNPDKRLPMASTTKIMNAILVLESLDLETTVLVSRNAHFEIGSIVGLYALDTPTVEQLLYWMLVFSGNDAAVALAEKTAGSTDQFVAMMNEKAKAMGLTNTHFTNANGLDRTGHYSSCTDLAKMALYAMKNETFRKIVSTITYPYPHPNSYTPTEPNNSNLLLDKYEWVTGVKTGSTPSAGYCLVATGTREGISLIMVELGAKDDDTRWSESEALFKYGFSFTPVVALAQPGKVLAQVPLGDPLGQMVDLVPKDLLVARLRKGQVATGTVSLSRALTLPIKAGTVLGSVEFTIDGRSLGKTDLVAGNSLSVPTLRSMVVHARNWYVPEFPFGDQVKRAAQQP